MVWVAVISVGLAIAIGATLGNDATAMHRNTNSKFRWDWNYESVRYFEAYKVGKTKIIGERNDDPSANGNTNRVKYWQPFDQEYGLGYIDFNSPGLKEYHICSSQVFFPEINGKKNRNKAEYSLNFNGGGTLYSLPWQTGTKNKVCHLTFKGGSTNGERNDVNFVDHLGAAQYMGQRFDVREYYSNGYTTGNGPDCKSPTVKLNHSASGGRPFASLHRGECSAVTILEFHFYPYKTLEWVDNNLRFTTVTYNKYYREYKQHSSCPKVSVPTYGKDENGNTIVTGSRLVNGTCWVNADNPKVEKYNMYVGGNAETTVTSNCPYGPETCPKIEDRIKIIDSISNLAELQTNYNSMQYIRKEAFDGMLKAEEDSIDGIGFDEKGQFKGVMRIDDIDDKGAEGYTPLSGAKRVYLTFNSTLKRNTPHVLVNPFTDDQRSIIQTNKAWYKKYCPEPAGHYCQFEWDGTKDASASKDWAAIYLEFHSSSSEPLILAYYTTSHASGISSEAVPIIYVVDDINDYSRDDPDAAAFYEVYDNTRKYYEQVYGKSIDTDEILKKRNIDPDKVLLYFNIATYSSYNPYLVNEAYLDFSASELPWYRDQSLTQIVNTEGSDFIDEATIYWSRISKKTNDFQNSCYSDNKSTITTSE